MVSKYLGDGAFEIDMSQKGIVSVASIITPAQVREMILNNRIGSGPGLDRKYMPTQNELENLLDMARDAITNGRLFDFGHWPNEIIKQTGARAGYLYNDSALGHPFSGPYLIMHTWSDPDLLVKFHDNPKEKNSCVYLVNPYPVKDEVCISFEICSFECMVIAGVKTLCVGDRVMFDGEQSKGQKLFYADIIPFAYRWMPDQAMIAGLATQLPEGTDFVRMAASNVLDPLMTALMILNTRGVKQETVTPPPKLAKARAKAGKPAIPPYRVVNSANYVTALLPRQERPKGPSQGGTHASPVFHLRRGHWRRMKETKKIRIQDTLVNATDEMRANFRMTRSHYSVKETEE